ncbi:RdgB/HAM1 family non-canonical purine NTP pyrophosphatase [Massilia sp. W12]|uniref:RdgB/HAM1 family non-canonical purine NTP pyrophosphatase n=1 Tax=Massilia sp. W12 TaxID=3126507 RepID=UPI0030D2DF4E
MSQILVLASDNAGKLREFDSLLAPLGFLVKPQKEFAIPAAEEPFGTFLENALAKARHAARLSGHAALADDSGICVPALGGAPGVHSARYAGEPKSDAANNRKLCQALQGHTERRAYYYCVLVFVRHADDPQPLVADGVWHGEIVDIARGEGGFGYDPYFWLPELGCSVAELDAARKNQLSHRGQAMRALAARLQDA